MTAAVVAHALVRPMPRLIEGWSLIPPYQIKSSHILNHIPEQPLTHLFIHPPTYPRP